MYRILGVLVALILAVGAGYWYGSGNGKTVTVEKEVVRTETQWKDRIVTVTRIVQPDGTVTETTKTEDREGSKKKDKTDLSTITAPVLSNYSLGIRYFSSYSKLLPKPEIPGISNIEITGSRRLLGPVWVELGGGLEHVNLGIRYEF